MSHLAYMIMLVIGYAAVPVGIYAFIHALIQRADAFAAVGKLSKPAWLAITGGGTVVCGLFPFASLLFIVWIAGLVANLVYIVDMRPKLIEIGRGS